MGAIVCLVLTSLPALLLGQTLESEFVPNLSALFLAQAESLRPVVASILEPAVAGTFRGGGAHDLLPVHVEIRVGAVALVDFLFLFFLVEVPVLLRLLLAALGYGGVHEPSVF